MNVKDLYNLSGKVAIITGAGRGIGEYIAKAFAESGVNIVLCSRKVENCQEVAEKLSSSYGVETLALKCDITNPSEVKEVVEKTIEKFGQINILVNNSGATWAASVEEMPLDAWEKVVNVNVTGTFIMTQEVGKVMIEQRSGKIINLSSIAGLGGTNPEYMNTIGYNTSKGAINTFTRDLAVKWGKYNINVNALAPGSFQTKMSKEMLEQSKDYFLSNTPLGRYGEEEDLKGVAVFLASKASNFITGEIITVDGGMSVIYS